MKKYNNSELACYMLLLYVIHVQMEYKNKPRYSKNRTKQNIKDLDGNMIYEHVIEPYTETLKKYLDMCELWESTNCLSLKEINSFDECLPLLDDIIKDKVFI